MHRLSSNELPRSPETFHRQETFVQNQASEAELNSRQLNTWESSNKPDGNMHKDQQQQQYRAEWARYSSRVTSKATLHLNDASTSRI